MSDTTYNGWTNYATWRVNLEMFDGISLEEFGFDEESEPRKIELYELAEALKERAEYYVSCDSKGFALDYALAFLSAVDWHEIAKHIIDDAEAA